MCVEPLLVYRRRPAQTLRHTHAHIGYRCGSCPLEPRKWTLSAQSSSATLESLFRLLQSTSQFAPTWLARENGTGPPRFREWVALITGARFPSSMKYSLYLSLFKCVHATLEPCTHIYMYLHLSIHPCIQKIHELPSTAPPQIRYSPDIRNLRVRRN